MRFRGKRWSCFVTCRGQLSSVRERAKDLIAVSIVRFTVFFPQTRGLYSVCVFLSATVVFIILCGVSGICGGWITGKLGRLLVIDEAAAASPLFLVVGAFCLL